MEVEHLYLNWLHETPLDFTGTVSTCLSNMAYYLNGELHREDGPAIEYPNGVRSWYLNGIEYTKGEVLARSTTLGKLIYKRLDK